MVDLVKARAKARKGEQQAASGERVASIEPVDKLEKFKAEAGLSREAAVEEAVAPVEELELLTFAIDGEQYAVEVARVMEIATPRPLTRVPNADPFIKGVMSLRGVVVTIVDVRGRLRHPQNGAGGQIVVVFEQGGPLGFAVDRVLRPVKIAPESIEAHPVVHDSETREAIRGVFRQGSALTILLDLDKLLA